MQVKSRLGVSIPDVIGGLRTVLIVRSTLTFTRLTSHTTVSTWAVTSLTPTPHHCANI